MCALMRINSLTFQIIIIATLIIIRENISKTFARGFFFFFEKSSGIVNLENKMFFFSKYFRFLISGTIFVLNRFWLFLRLKKKFYKNSRLLT